MITASIGSHRFESGPTYHYNASGIGDLIGVMFESEGTTNYVNMLNGVNATQEEIRQVAAAGIVRLAVDGPEYKYVTEASSMLLHVCQGQLDVVPKDIFKDLNNWREDYKVRGVLSNSSLDSASILATRKNDAVETAGIIAAHTQSDEGILVIGLANGGIISAAHTFMQLNQGDNELTFVRYSRYKKEDKEPNMYPYPQKRKDSLKHSAKGRQVLVYDEDHSSGKTLKTAVDYFAELFGKAVIGIAPVEVERRITYNPLVIKSD